MLDKKYDFKEKEIKWMNYWKENNIYEFKNDGREVFSIDTPPPTVNGKIHMGHIFSYSQLEIIARYKRLCGFDVFFPFGFDDNGLPSERLVEKEIGKKTVEIGREEFSKKCFETTSKYEEDFKKLFYRMGYSANLKNPYKTVSPLATKLSQKSFIDLVNSGNCYRKKSPTMWCNECLTSIAQAEIETKNVQTTFNYLKFRTLEDNKEFIIATTRPELLPAIVCVFVNPLDKKNKHLIGKNAFIPLIHKCVPIKSDELVDKEKGSGIVMCCTFGDTKDIYWHKKYNLPLVEIFTEDGKIKENIKDYGGLKILDARAKIIEDLKSGGFIEKEETIDHDIQTHERCGNPVEYRIMQEWFINLIDKKDAFLEYGDKINWYPKYMKTRYNNWVKNLLWDWCISRQRYFGVPFPVWYCKNCGEIKLAEINDLPVNPLIDTPKTPCSCGSTDFYPENDVFDTWATSSLTEHIAEAQNKIKFDKPFSLRGNAHDNIRVWDFYTIVKSYYHSKQIPWENVMISGFIMASKNEKMSKSKGNTSYEPLALIEKYSADAVRYYSGSGKLGLDAIFDENMFDRGRKLINKIWNVSKFCDMHLVDFNDKDFSDFEYMDKWILEKFKKMEENFTKYAEKFEVGLALTALEKFFWNFCDNYIEIVKHRLYRPDEFGEKPRYSGQKTIYIILYKMLQYFSIYFPFITEEIYQAIYKKEKSIHLTKIEPLNCNFKKELINGDIIIDIISQIRGEKSKKGLSLKTNIKNLEISLNPNLEDAIKRSIKDFKATLFIDNLTIKRSKDNYHIEKIKLEEKNN